MEGITIYRHWFVFVYGCYLFLNKGIAYTYLSEITWLLGVLLFIRHFKRINIAWGKVLGFILFFLLINAVNMVKGFSSFAVLDVIRDSFILNYSFFVFIVFLFWDERKQVLNQIAALYRYFPLALTASFIIRSLFPDHAQWEVFGKVSVLLYKNGDLAVHLLITVMFILTGKLKWENPRLAFLNYILLLYLLLLAATYNRGGTLAFIVCLSFFIYKSRDTEWFNKIKLYFKWLPFIIALAIPLYLSTNLKVEDKEYGRQIGISQLKDNFVSIVAKDATKSNAGLEGNITWRLVWWAKIYEYTFIGPYFWQGKGLGVNLAVDDDIQVEGEELRSPHNISMTILARYGVPFFFIWLLFLYFVFQPLLSKKVQASQLLLGTSLCAIFINASFDVSLEGPMMAFPFWSILGFYLMEQSQSNEHALK